MSGIVPTPPPASEPSVFEPLAGQHVATGRISMYAASRGSGPALVFLHGLGWSHALWRRQFERLAPAYRVVGADTRGHGQSDKPEGPYSMQEFAADWLGFDSMLDSFLAAHYPPPVAGTPARTRT